MASHDAASNICQVLAGGAGGGDGRGGRGAGGRGGGAGGQASGPQLQDPCFYETMCLVSKWQANTRTAGPYTGSVFSVQSTQIGSGGQTGIWTGRPHRLTVRQH